MAETNDALLASEWQAFRTLWVNRNRSENEIEMVRLAFYYGARCALYATVHSPRAVAQMATEMRAFDGEHSSKDAGQCRVENIL